MSDLQIVLIIIGGIIIVAVLVLNWWQEKRFHQQVENSFSNLNSDALLEEPKLDLGKVHDTEDGFSIANDSLEEITQADEYDVHLTEQVNQQFNDKLEEITSIIDAVYTELVTQQNTSDGATKVEPHIDTDTISAAANLNADVKPVQHEGIKAIFDDAFSSSANSSIAQNEDAKASTNQVNEITLEEPALSLPAMLHAQMDLVAMLYLAAESTIGEVSKVINGLFDGYDKPIFVHVLDSDLQWLLLNEVSSKPELASHKVSKITCSLQLADRAGPVSRSVLNRFQLTVETLGLDIDAHVEWQSTGDPLAMATALDAFCIEVDKTMGFHLAHGENGAFTGTKLRGLAEAQGLELASDGTFKYYDEAANKQTSSNPVSNIRTPSFVMFNRDHYPFSLDMLRTSVVKAITFQLDIPHVKHCTEAFNHMVQVAKQMEAGLNAQLIDDNNKTLGDIQIEKIRHQLKVIHATMLTRGIVPGSDSAHRLFS